MPSKPRTPCREQGCPELLTKPGRCRAHQTKYDQRVTTSVPWNPKGSYGSAWSKISKQVLKEEPMCKQGCGRPSRVADHIVARRFGGTDQRSNLQGLCRQCHGGKTEQEMAEYRRRKA